MAESGLPMPGTVLVTGATGFVGSHLARLLVARGQSLRLLVRPTSDRARLAGIEAELVEGSVCDAAAVRRAVQGCSDVYHVAGDYRLWARHPRELYETNFGGTRTVLLAAGEAGVGRVVYTSSVGTISARPDGAPVTENSESSIKSLVGHYKKSKLLAEREAFRQARAGLPVVIVSPTAPVGERDFRPTPTGRIILDFLRGRMPAYVDTGLNFVDVRVVAVGHWLAARSGRVGQRYLLGTENHSLRDILEMCGQISGLRAPRLRLPYPVAWIAGACSTGLAELTRSPPAIPIEGVRMARRPMYADSGKARRELGFSPGPVREALRRAIRWFRARAPRDGHWTRRRGT